MSEAFNIREEYLKNCYNYNLTIQGLAFDSDLYKLAFFKKVWSNSKSDTLKKKITRLCKFKQMVWKQPTV